jgi:hypothetical protein
MIAAAGKTAQELATANKPLYIFCLLFSISSGQVRN